MCGGFTGEHEQMNMKGLFTLLDDIRSEGTMNMLAAPSWLVANGYCETKEEAREVFFAWQEYLSLGEVS
jgi:hypothetical protein